MELIAGIMLDVFFFTRFIVEKLNSTKPRALRMVMEINTLLSLFMETKDIIMFAV